MMREQRQRFLSLRSDVIEQRNWLYVAYCPVTNRCHSLIETLDANLWKRMRAHRFLRRPPIAVGCAVAIFSRALENVLGRQDACLSELARYLVLNPVPAALAVCQGDWVRSS